MASTSSPQLGLAVSVPDSSASLHSLFSRRPISGLFTCANSGATSSRMCGFYSDLSSGIVTSTKLCSFSALEGNEVVSSRLQLKFRSLNGLGRSEQNRVFSTRLRSREDGFMTEFSDIVGGSPSTERKSLWSTFLNKGGDSKNLNFLSRVKYKAPLATAHVAVTDNSQVPFQKKAPVEVFLFHIEGGGQVKALVEKTSNTTSHVEIEVDMSIIDGPLLLHWGLFRSNSADWMLLDSDVSPLETKYYKGKAQAMRTPLQLQPNGLRTLHLEFDAAKKPFYVHFVLYQPAEANGTETWIRSTSFGNFCIPVGIGKGQPDPLGLTWKRRGSVNFALYSKNAVGVVLCLYKDDATEPSMEIDLEPSIHRTGDVWHVELENVSDFTRYGYRCKGDASWENGSRFHARHVLLDPYAKVLAPFVPGQESLPSPALMLGSLKRDNVQFNWEDDAYPRIPLERLVVYKLNVANFTSDESSGLEEGIRGTFDGLSSKIQHLVNLGVNAVILEPIFEHDSCPLLPLSFFAPAARYGPGDSSAASVSLKRMVKHLHSHGIEVMLDVVYSHTAEGGDDSPKNISFRGLDNSTFYILDGFGAVIRSDFGTENAFNCNHPVVQRMIVDSLRHWVEEYHVDGFVFVNGTALVTGPHGQELSRPVLVESISFDPILASTKLIVDSFSPFTRISKPLPFPHWRRWCELNSLFRNDVRCYLRGHSGELSKFATRLCGSGDIFANGRGPSYSMNYVTSSYGFTLADLVSFSDTGGAASEFSWNCGAEGPTEDSAVLETRVKQVRNFIMALFLSEGVPVLNMGDEYGHSKGGHLDLEQSSGRFFWSYLESDFGQQITRLISSLIHFRSRRKDLFQRNSYAEPGTITWHGADSREPHWELQESSFLGARILAPKQEGGARGQGVADLYVAFNPHEAAVVATLPDCSKGMRWHRIADTSLPHPDDFVVDGIPVNVQSSSSLGGIYELQPFSSIMLEAKERSIVPGGKTPLKFPVAAPLAK